MLKPIDKKADIEKFDLDLSEKRVREASFLKNDYSKHIDENNFICSILDKIENKSILLEEEDAVLLKNILTRFAENNLTNIRNLRTYLL